MLLKIMKVLELAVFNILILLSYFDIYYIGGLETIMEADSPIKKEEPIDQATNLAAERLKATPGKEEDSWFDSDNESDTSLTG